LGNVYCDLFEFSDMTFAFHVVRDGDLFIDIGANVGVYTILCGGGKGTRCVTFEPLPATFLRLLDNLAINQLRDRVTPHNVALADKPGVVQFTSAFDAMNHVALESDRADNSVSVPTHTLDSLVHPAEPTLIKLDVEGFEVPVLRGAAAVLANPNVHSLIIELNGSGKRYGFTDSQIIDIADSYGFKPFSYEPRARRLAPRVLGSQLDGNVIFVRDVEAVKQRLMSSEPLMVGNEAL